MNGWRKQQCRRYSSQGFRFILGKIFLGIKKKTDKEYKPDTLKAYQASVHFYLSDEQYDGNILKDDGFKHSREVQICKRKSLKQQGLGIDLGIGNVE